VLRFPSGSRRFFALPALLLGLTASPAAAAQLPRDPLKLDPGEGPGYWHGSADHLPSLPGMTERQILDHAHTMPAVQELLREAERRGYVRHPRYDRALVQNDPRRVLALLSLEKPNFSPPPGANGAPLLQVATVDVYGSPRTSTSLLFVIVEEATGNVHTADEEPSMPDDRTIEILDGPPGGGPGPVRLHPEWTPSPQLAYCGKRFLVCSAAANIACVLQALYPPSQPWQAKVIRLAVCSVLSTSFCVLDFIDCLHGKGLR
jgi:hypothetical protein